MQTHVKTNLIVPYGLCFGFCETNFSSLRERRFLKCHDSTVGRMFIIIEIIITLMEMCCCSNEYTSDTGSIHSSLNGCSDNVKASICGFSYSAASTF